MTQFTSTIVAAAAVATAAVFLAADVLFTRDGASAVDEGQGRKIRKSRTEGFSGGRNRRE